MRLDEIAIKMGHYVVTILGIHQQNDIPVRWMIKFVEKSKLSFAGLLEPVLGLFVMASVLG